MAADVDMLFSASEFMEYINSREGRYARLAYFNTYGPITLDQARSFIRLRLGPQADDIERMLSEIEAAKSHHSQ